MAHEDHNGSEDRRAMGDTLKFRIGEDLHEKLAELAARSERTTAGEARLAIREHLRRAEVVAGK